MKPERHGIVDHRFARSHEQVHDFGSGFIVGVEGQTRPFLGDLFGAEGVVPGHAAKRIPVRLRPRMAGPVAVRTGVRHASNRREFVAVE